MDKEHKIKEQRTIEATRDNLMGLNGKLGMIARFLGVPIVAQSEGGPFLDTGYLNYGIYEEVDPFELKSGTPEDINRQIQAWETGDQRPDGPEWNPLPDGKVMNSYFVGWLFDGLSRGIHMEIKYYEESSELRVDYKGYMVYKEVAGELEAYAPDEEWRSKIEVLYKRAKELERDHRKLEQIERHEQGLKKRANWLKKMKDRWNFQ